ncbi:MAG TPA: AfsR/SARP family transcriptional regulator [Pseudonocardiaceae bacterium]
MRRVWGDETPAGARETLHSYVMRLRRTLGQAAGTPVVTCPDGYLIEVADGALDLDRFTSLVAQGKAADDPDATVGLLRAAGDLWRGDPLADVPSDVLRQEVVPALSERRLDATEAAVDAALRSGRHSDVVAELADLTTKHPLRERFWAQRMLAVYRSGRPAEALQCYDTARKLLAEALGVDPGTELRALHQSVLVNDPALAAPAPRHGRNDLPGDIPDFAGRAEQLRRLVDLVPANGSPGAVIISAIDGMAGIGKTEPGL